MVNMMTACYQFYESVKLYTLLDDSNKGSFSCTFGYVWLYFSPIPRLWWPPEQVILPCLPPWWLVYLPLWPLLNWYPLPRPLPEFLLDSNVAPRAMWCPVGIMFAIHFIVNISKCNIIHHSYGDEISVWLKTL